MARVVVAGAAMAGLRAAEQLRAAGWREAITVVGDEPHMPYNRPPLSKEALAGSAPFDSLAFPAKAHTADVEWRLGTAVTAADLTARQVVLDGGETIGFDGLVIATGLRPRRLSCPEPTGPGSGRHTLRTLGDARRLRGELTRPGVRLVVVGAGFIGCEVAATAVGLGVREVTVVDPEPLPMLRPLGKLLAREVRRRHELHGVRFALGQQVAGYEQDGAGRVAGVRLAGGGALPADVVVEAVGALPNTEWLAGNGLDLADGVRTDALLRVAGLPHVVAVGDVACFPNPRYGAAPRRVEHWSMAGESARHAARTLLAHLRGGEPAPEPFAPLPTFWSDQHDFRLRSFGAPALGADEVRLLEGEAAGDLVAGYHADGLLVGVVALGGPAAAAGATRYRARLLRQPALTA